MHADRGTDTTVNPTDWDRKVALRNAYAELRADFVSEQLGVDVKSLAFLAQTKARRTGIGVVNAVRRGLVVIDEAGSMRCPPGTPNAMWFTDMRGSNCGVPGMVAKPGRVAIGEIRDELDRRGIKPVTAAEIATTRLGMRSPSQGGRRGALAEATRATVTGAGDKGSGWDRAFSLLRIPNEGFSLDMNLGENVNSGYGIARPGRGIRIKASELYDDNGDVKEEGAIRLARMIAANADEFTQPAEVTVDGKTYVAERVVLGAWRSPSDEYVYFDVTDVFPQDMDVNDAIAIGAQRNQQSIANLGKIAEENVGRYKMREDGVAEDEIPGLSWVEPDEVAAGAEGALIGTGGTGADLLPETELPNTGTVRLFAEGGELESVLKGIEGTGTLDLENFDEKQIKAMLGYLKSAPGFGWIDPDNPEHLYLALMQLSENLVMLMRDTTPAERAKWRRWYDIANTFNEELATRFGLPSNLVHAVTARFSPQKDWDQNTAMSEHALKLLTDDEYLVGEEVAVRAFGYATEQWASRNSKGKRGSHDVRVRKAEEEYDKAMSATEKELASVAKWESAKPTKSATESLRKARKRLADNRERLALAEAVYNEALAAKEADTKPTIDDFRGKSLADMSIDNAAAVIRAHGELEGGAYLGQPPVAITDKTPAGVSPRALLAYKTIIPDDPENPGEHTVEGNPSQRVRAQSMDVYRSVVNIFRSGGDHDIIDKELGSGAKVRSFNNNMASPNDLVHRDTTIDTHAVAAELGIPVAASHDLTNLAFQYVASLGTTQAYPLMRAAMIAAALRWEAETGEKYLPREIQSITWEKMRDLVPAKAKRFVSDRVAQIQRLGAGPDGDPRFKGQAGYDAAKRLYEAATVDVDALNKARPRKGRGYIGPKYTRKGLLESVIEELGLPPLTSADVLKKAKKGTAAASGEAATGDD